MSGMFRLLAGPSGAARVGYDDGTAINVLDTAKPMQSYTALRAYTGRANGVRITAKGLAGFFQRDDADTTSSDNGGTIIVDASGRRWKRLFDGNINVKWFGAIGDGVADSTEAIQAAIDAAYANSPVANGRQVGGEVFLPKGRYRITETLTGITNGITISGEPSGLDSVPLTQYSSGSQLFCDNGVAGFPMFTVNDGGPIMIRDIGINGTQTVTNSTCILSGTGSENTGVTQAHFSNVRFTGFSTVISAAKFFDVSFYDCGFEYNTTCFLLTGGAHTVLADIKFVSCIFYGGASSVFSLSGGAILDNVSFSSCLFENDQNQVVNCDVFKVYDATLSNVAFSSCNFKGYAGDNCIRTVSANSSLKAILFAACNFKTINAMNIPYQAPIGAVYDIIYNACSFQDSNISAAYELGDLIIANSLVRGTSVVNLSSCNNLAITGCDFANASANPPIVLSDIFNRVLVANNIFADAVTSIPINGASTKIKMVGNIYINDVLMP